MSTYFFNFEFVKIDKNFMFKKTRKFQHSNKVKIPKAIQKI